ncbi:hypothetical protein AMTRI_Chr07g27150 [Amborella trichopoda]
MGHSCIILAAQHFMKGYFPQSVLHQFHYTQNYTSPGEAIDRRPIFPLCQHSSTLLVKASLSWKGKKSSSSEGLAKKDMATTTSNYDSWWERICPLLLCLNSSRLRGEKITPLVLINESNRMRTYPTLAWKMLKLNWLDGWPSWQNSRRRTLIRSRRLNNQTYCLLFIYLFIYWHE